MKRAFWLGAAVLLPRLLLFPLNENLGGDAIARTWLAHRWLESPHLITSFDGGGAQFGPLHIYLLALAEWLWPSLLHAGRLVSFLAGVLTAWPLFDFTRRRFGARAGELAVLAFACWGLHLQCSTTSASEALNLLWVMAAVSAFDRLGSERSAWFPTVLFLNLACATRYDSWLLVPIFVLAHGLRTRSLRSALRLCVGASVFAAAWMVGNFVARGDALFPLAFIDRFHRAWWPSEAALWGEGRYRLMCLLFWPGAAVLMLTPALFLPACLALPRVWREYRELRWLVVLVLCPALLYGLRGAVFGSFAPLARFTVKEVLLLLPLSGWWLSSRTRSLQLGAIALLSVSTVGMGWYCWQPDGGLSFSLRSISATSRLDSSQRSAAVWLQAQAGDGLLIVDEDPAGFDDLTVSYFSGRPFDQQLRRRYERYQEVLSNRTPRWLVLFANGRLERDGAVVIAGAHEVVFQGAHFVEGFEGQRLRIFTRQP